MSASAIGSSSRWPIGESSLARSDHDGVGAMTVDCRSNSDEVFVYGTLVQADRVATVLDDWSFGPDAVLSGLHRVMGAYPTLVPGGRVCGRIVRTSEIDALDRYEGVDRGLYVRVSVPWADRDDRAWVYIGDPGRLGCSGADPWPGSGPFEQRVRSVVTEPERSIRIAEC